MIECETSTFIGCELQARRVGLRTSAVERVGGSIGTSKCVRTTQRHQIESDV